MGTSRQISVNNFKGTLEKAFDRIYYGASGKDPKVISAKVFKGISLVKSAYVHVEEYPKQNFLNSTWIEMRFRRSKHGIDSIYIRYKISKKKKKNSVIS